MEKSTLLLKFNDMHTTGAEHFNHCTLFCYYFYTIHYCYFHIHTHTISQWHPNIYFWKGTVPARFVTLVTKCAMVTKRAATHLFDFPSSKTASCFFSAYFNSNCTDIHETILMWANSITLYCLLWTSDFRFRYLCHDASSNNRKNNNIAENTHTHMYTHTQKHLQFLNKLIEQNKECDWVSRQRIKTDYHYSMKHMQNFI